MIKVTPRTKIIQSPPSIRVFIVEDHPIVRHGLKQLIETQQDLKVCTEAEVSF